MRLVLDSNSDTVRTLRNIEQRCKDHLPGNEFGKLLYENQERGTVTVYPRLKYYNGSFGTTLFEEGDVEVNPWKYLKVKCDVVAVLHIEGILIGTKTTLLVKVLEVEVSKPKKQPRRKLLGRKLLGRTPVVKAETDSDSRSMNSRTCPRFVRLENYTVKIITYPNRYAISNIIKLPDG